MMLRTGRDRRDREDGQEDEQFKRVPWHAHASSFYLYTHGRSHVVESRCGSCQFSTNGLAVWTSARPKLVGVHWFGRHFLRVEARRLIVAQPGFLQADHERLLRID